MPAGAPGPDLLIVGGLTIDRLADGSLAPGGSALHATRALHRAAAVDVLTVAGDEPIAQAGLTELRLLARRVVCLPAPRTIAFRHAESAAGRRSWLEPVSAIIAWDEGGTELPAPRILFAPVAGEIGPELLAAWSLPATRAAILQGWLRDVAHDTALVPKPLRAVDRQLLAALDRLDILVASREDLLGESDEPRAQLDALRSRLPGPRLLAVTDGPRGAWVDASVGGGRRRWHARVPRVVAARTQIGAGDVFAASLVLHSGRDPHAAVAAAAEATAAWLEAGER